jgi:molecular chaperone GrpE
LDKRNILVVTASADDQKRIEEKLSDDFAVLHAKHPKLALAVFDSVRPWAVVTDVSVGTSKAGLHLCRELRQRGAGKRCFFIAYKVAEGVDFSCKNDVQGADRMLVSSSLPLDAFKDQLQERLAVTSTAVNPVVRDAKHASPTVGELLDEGMSWKRIKGILTKEIHLGPKPPDELPDDLRELGWAQLLTSSVNTESIRAILTKPIGSGDLSDPEGQEEADGDVPGLEDLREELEALRARNKTLAGELALLREAEGSKLRTNVLKQVLNSLLPVVDDLDHLSIGPSAKKEVGLLRDKTLDSLRKLGIVGLGASGEVFDPKRHMALHEVETVIHDKGTVVEVIQRGFALDGHVIRPAHVLVAKIPGS